MQRSFDASLQTSAKMDACVCVCVCTTCPPVLRVSVFNYAIPIAKSFPPMTSLPYLGLVVLPLQTPQVDLARRVSN